MKKLEIGQAVRVTEDFLTDYPDFGSPVGKIVGVSEEGCVHGETWEVEFEDGACEWMYPCDLEIVESESPYEEDEAELDELLERAAAVAEEHTNVARY